jgi:uncharacterized protein YlaI
VEKKQKYLRTQKNQTKSEDNCPVCDKNLYWDEDTTQRVGLLDEDNRIEGWMCPYCNSLFDLDENLTYISLPETKVGKA